MSNNHFYLLNGISPRLDCEVNNLLVDGNLQVLGNFIGPTGSTSSTFQNITVINSIAPQSNGVPVIGSSTGYFQSEFVNVINCGTGLYLPTIGGTGSQLNFFQTDILALSATGLWTSPQACTGHIQRIGNSVTLNVTGVSTTAGLGSVNVISLGPALPSQYRPGSLKEQVIVCQDNTTHSWGVFDINTDGTMGMKYNYTTFSGTGTSGFSSFGTSWRV